MALKKYKFIKGKNLNKVVEMYEEQIGPWIAKGLIEEVKEEKESKKEPKKKKKNKK